ncbi:MAG TPA: hypothetical protein ENF95_01170 [Candidatus Aenigmarchaeota archaeon]|nr:hypothetical protein [Candidatus Aenigmarchaeota archaeon]
MQLKYNAKYKEGVMRNIGHNPFLCTSYLLTENWQGKLRGKIWLPDKQFSIPVTAVKSIHPEKDPDGMLFIRVFLDVDWCVQEYYWLKGFLNTEPERKRRDTIDGAKTSLV